MSIAGRLSTAELAAFWRVRPTSLARWRSRSGVTMGEHESPHPKSTIYYRFSELDEYHRANLHPATTMFPSAAELWGLQLSTGQPALLTVPEVATKVHLTAAGVYYHLVRGHLPATKVMSDWHIPAPALGPFRAWYDARNTVSVRSAQRMTGLSVGTLSLLSQGDDPEIARADAVGSELRFDKKSFLAFLDRYLVNCSVDRWYALRQLHNYEQLITVHAVRRTFHVNARRFRHLMEPGEGNWPYLRTPGGETRIPYHVVEQWKARSGRR